MSIEARQIQETLYSYAAILNFTPSPRLYHGPFKWRAVLLLIFLGFAKVCTQVLDIGFLFYPTIFLFQKLQIFVSQNASIMINDTSIICVSVVRALLA